MGQPVLAREGEQDSFVEVADGAGPRAVAADRVPSFAGARSTIDSVASELVTARDTVRQADRADGVAPPDVLGQPEDANWHTAAAGSRRASTTPRPCWGLIPHRFGLGTGLRLRVFDQCQETEPDEALPK